MVQAQWGIEDSSIRNSIANSWQCKVIMYKAHPQEPFETVSAFDAAAVMTPSSLGMGFAFFRLLLM